MFFLIPSYWQLVGNAVTTFLTNCHKNRMENVHPTFAGILRGFETATVEPQGRRVAANRINHKDTEFDADYATVVGNDARNYQIGSFIEIEFVSKRYEVKPEDIVKKRMVSRFFNQRGKSPMSEDEYRMRVANGQSN